MLGGGGLAGDQGHDGHADADAVADLFEYFTYAY